jgi:hypothetical protein
VTTIRTLSRLAALALANGGVSCASNDSPTGEGGSLQQTGGASTGTTATDTGGVLAWAEQPKVVAGLTQVVLARAPQEPPRGAHGAGVRLAVAPRASVEWVVGAPRVLAHTTGAQLVGHQTRAGASQAACRVLVGLQVAVTHAWLCRGPQLARPRCQARHRSRTSEPK